MVNAMRREADAGHNIHKQARGFVFLGTPHKGSALTIYGKMRSLLGYWNGSSIDLLEIMNPGSQINKRLHDDFMGLLTNGCGVKNTLCVIETRKETVFGIPIASVSVCSFYNMRWRLIAF